MTSVQSLPWLLAATCACLFVITSCGPTKGLEEEEEKRNIGCRDRDPTCGSMRSQLAHLCYDPLINRKCCHSCFRYRVQLRLPSGCEYGDRTPSECMLVRSRHCSSEHTKHFCCATCDKYSPQESVQMY